MYLEGLTINPPMMRESVDERGKIERLFILPKRLIGDNEVITIREVDVVCTALQLKCFFFRILSDEI